MTQLSSDTITPARWLRSDSTAQENRFIGAEGVQIFYRSWRPEGTPRALVVIAPGFNAHSGHYEWVARRLVMRGFAVYAIDHRGRGKSEGERFFVTDVSEHVDDLKILIGQVKARDPNIPVFLLGHSAGGVISASFTLDHQQDIDGLITEAAAFEVPGPKFALTLFKGLSRILPHAGLLKLQNKYFSRDPDVVAAMNDDELIANEKQPTATLAALVRADERLVKEAGKITLPVLVIHGTADKVTVPHGSQAFYDHLGSTDKTIQMYGDNYHDLLQDLERDRVLADIERWINARLPV